MDMTLSLRRKDVVINKPPVSQILQRWPALFRESQVYQEFNRVVGKNLKQEFYGSLDRHCPQLIQIFRSKRGLAGQILSDLLQQAKASDDGDSYQHVPVGILSLENEDVALQPLSIHLHPSSVGIILEGNVVMDNLDNIPQAMCLLFGLTYALHLGYPKCMGNTFLFIQQVLLGLGKKELKGKILAVTNQLTM
ncbi:uncharacterized protein LOC130100539 isoform X2 [Rhinichthys klamathensis goyatoka]|uniref:uncharacterized protein LOC130081231 isoform X2 n=1 Tax=Rhinichthys klamathensis goyatoka TaxID=3034132 RepID=UPI0024B55469|nr:uncharacterized protein LOC130081231 isoform X2 [Rhinichthys klamathensis goyatoka]XP_056111380.1 uncharacterized protein LOC130088582 isoform X2 [Rhinichthys klamathensis goyatoka]XP_056111596.1 uncharacterized protein LOC130088700 isoform X2 [Rhinichthys klamathensis goyatoka]XP_056122005.1 uncharacterized protein LOC130100539 isoform X2 [Rhinichthys klamathensis goyatoka]